MSIAVFKKWTGAVLYLNEKIKNNRLIAGRNIQLENTGNGIRIHGSSNNPGGDTYNGYFKVIQTAPNKIKIVDGFDVAAANCGKVKVNKLALAPVTATELTISADAYIYLQCIGVYTLGILTNSTNTIVQYAEEQSWEAGKGKELISRVKFDAPIAPATIGNITNFTNERAHTRIYIIGVC